MGIQYDLTAKREEMENKLADQEAKQADLATELAKLKKAEPVIQQEVKDAVEAFKNAARLVNEGVAAVQSFNSLKVLVTSTVTKMWVYFEDSVLDALTDLGLPNKATLNVEDYFEKDYEANEE